MENILRRSSTLALGLALFAAVVLFDQVFLTCFPPPKLAALAVMVPLALALASAVPGTLAAVPAVSAPLAAAMAWLLLGLARAAYPDSLASFFMLPASALAGAWMAASLAHRPAEKSRLLAAIVLAHFVCGFYAVLQYYGFDPAGWTLQYGRGRVFSTMGNPNFLAGQMVLVLPVLAALGSGTIGWTRWFSRSTFVACLLALVFAQTRGAWVGLFAGLVVAGVVGFRARAALDDAGRRLAWAAAVGALVIALFSLPSLNPTGLSLPAQLSSSANLEQQSARQRFFWWRAAAAQFSAAPVAGRGLGSFMRDFPSFSLGVIGPWSDLPPAFADHPHNDWLYVLCEHGVIGLGLLLWLAAAGGRVILKRIREGSLLHLGILAGFTGLGVHAVWNMPSLQQGTLVTAGVLLGLGCAADRKPGTAPGFRPVFLAAGLGLSLVLAFRPAVLLLAQDYFNGGRIMKEDRSQGSDQVAAFLLRDTLKLTRAPWRVNFMLGSVLYGKGYYNEALQAFRDDETENPFGADAVLHQGKCLREMGRIAEAGVACRRALRLVPNYAEAAFTIAGMDYNAAVDLRKAGRRRDAAAAIARAHVWLNYALHYSPRHMEALVLQGHVYVLESRWREALASWEKALDANPTNDRLRYKVESLRVDLPRLLRGGKPR